MNTSSDEQAWPRALHWWIDAVGGFLTFRTPQIRIGQAGTKENDVAVLADISGHHADLKRSDSGVVLVAHDEASVNGKRARSFLLRDGDRIQMRALELTYHQPLRWSTTARLELTSDHRLPLALDGIVLLGETCLVGPGPDVHIPARWDASVVVNWYRDRYWVRGPGPLTIDGKEFAASGPLKPSSQVKGPWGSFRFEPLRD